MFHISIPKTDQAFGEVLWQALRHFCYIVIKSGTKFEMRPDRASLRPYHREVYPVLRRKPSDRGHTVSECGGVSAKYS